jgi:hypothetical protein
MEKQDLIDQLNEIEKFMHMPLPSKYKRFMIENVRTLTRMKFNERMVISFMFSIVLIYLKEIIPMQFKKLSRRFIDWSRW